MPDLSFTGWRELAWAVDVNGQQHLITVKWENSWQLTMIIEVDRKEINKKSVLISPMFNGTYPITIDSKVFTLEISGISGGIIDLKHDGKVIPDEYPKSLAGRRFVPSASPTNAPNTSSAPAHAQPEYIVTALQQAANMFDQGLIDESEYKALKAKIIGKV